MKKVQLFKSTTYLEGLQKEIDKFLSEPGTQRELVDIKFNENNYRGDSYYSAAVIYKHSGYGTFE